MKNALEKNYLKLGLYNFFHSFIIAYAIERLFWEQRGMTVQLVVFAEIIYSLVVAALEIPTGYIADRFSRKWTMVVGALFVCFEMVILIFATEFWHFALAVSLAAIHGAAVSGTENAMLYDSLKAVGDEETFEKKIGRLRFVEYGSHMIAALIGGVVAVKLGFVSTYWFSLVSTLLALVVSLTLVEPPIRTAEEGDPADKALASRAYGFIRERPHIQFVLAYGVITGACLVYVDEFWQLYAHGVGVPIALFGVVLGVNCLLTSLSGLVAYKLKGRVPYKVLFASVLALFTLGVALMATVNRPVGLLFLFVAYGSAGIIEPLVAGYLHHRASSEFRATVESFQSLAFRLVSAGIGLIFGYVSTHYSISTGFSLLGTLLCAALVMYLLVGSLVTLDVQATSEGTA